MDRKLSKQKAEQLKQKIKARLIHSEDELFEESEDTPEDIYNEIKNKLTRKELSEFLEDLHDVDIANYLQEYCNDKELLRIFNALDIEDKASLLEYSELELQERIIELIPEEEVLDIFSYMSPDDIADILGYIDVEKKKTLLNKMKKSEANKIYTLLGYKEDSAGGIMTTEYLAFKKNMDLKSVLNSIKKIAPKTEYIESVFVLESNGVLLGEADLRDILIMPHNTLLEDITDESIKYVYVDDDQEKVAQLVSKYSLKVVPVVNKKNNLLGIITIDDVLDVIEEENTEDILKLAGTADDEELETPLLDGVKKRVPWLIINLGTAFLASFVVSMFENTLSAVVALAVTMPIVSGMGGNAGTQGLAVTIRSIALGEYDPREKFLHLVKYIGVGLISGASLGILGGIIVFAMFSNIYLSLVLFLAMIGDVIVGCVAGFLIPIILKAIKIDPAQSSAVILTTFTDVCGFVFYLGIATIMLMR